MPKRLLHVTDPSEGGDEVRLVEPVYVANVYQYAVLSHCRGGEQPARLLEDDLTSLKHGLDKEQLGKVYQDAFQVTRRVGLSYTWIDSLCIVQDSAEDWLEGSAIMGEIWADWAGHTCEAIPEKFYVENNGDSIYTITVI